MKHFYLITAVVFVMIPMTACRVIDYGGAVRRAQDLAIRHPQSSFQGLLKARDLEFESIHFQTHDYGDLIETTFRLRGAPRFDKYGRPQSRLCVHMKSNGELYNFFEGGSMESLDWEFGEFMVQ